MSHKDPASDILGTLEKVYGVKIERFERFIELYNLFFANMTSLYCYEEELKCFCCTYRGKKHLDKLKQFLSEELPLIVRSHGNFLLVDDLQERKKAEEHKKEYTPTKVENVDEQISTLLSLNLSEPYYMSIRKDEEKKSIVLEFYLGRVAFLNRTVKCTVILHSSSGADS